MAEPANVVELVCTLPHSHYHVHNTPEDGSDGRAVERGDSSCKFHNLNENAAQRRKARPVYRGYLKRAAHICTGALTKDFNEWVKADCPLLNFEKTAKYLCNLKKRIYARHNMLLLPVVQFFTLSRHLFTTYAFRDFLTHLIEEVQTNPHYSGQILASNVTDGFIGLPANSTLEISRSYFIDQECQPILKICDHGGQLIFLELRMKFRISTDEADWADLAAGNFVQPYPVADHFSNPSRWLRGLTDANGGEMIFFCAPDVFRMCCLRCRRFTTDYTPCEHSICDDCKATYAHGGVICPECPPVIQEEAPEEKLQEEVEVVPRRKPKRWYMLLLPPFVRFRALVQTRSR